VRDAPRFLERHDADRHWRVDAEFAPALEALGWPALAAVEEALRGAGSQGRSATAILALPGRGERIHLRPVLHGGLLGPLWRGAIWGADRPLAELEATASLRAAGAPVPRPVLVAAHRRAGPLWTAVIGTVHVEGGRDGLAWLASRPDPDRLRRGARAAGAAIRRFHDAGGQHADLQPKNLLFREGARTTEVTVIDLDRSRSDAPPDAARRMRELMRLVRGLRKRGAEEVVGARGLLAGWSAYCAGDRDLRCALIGHLHRERRRLARHSWAHRLEGPRGSPLESAGSDELSP